MDQSHFNIWANVTAAGTIITTLLGWVPAIAGVVALVWYLIQIYESQTARRWLANRRAKKLARLRAKIILLEAADQLHPVLPPDDGA